MLSPTSMMLAPLIVIPERDERFRPGLKGELSATWEMWDVIRTICDYSPRLTLSKQFLNLLFLFLDLSDSLLQP
jgi:hypothetical protein